MEKEVIYSENQSTLRTFFKYLLPSMLGMALVAVYTFTDTFVVGRKFGAIALGAMGICTPVITVTYALGFMFGIGGGSLYSICRGRRDEAQANSFFTTSAVSLLAFGVVLAVVGNIFMEDFAYFLGADEGNIEYVLPYLRCLLVYIPGFMLDQLMTCFIRNDGHPNVAMTAVVVGTGMNVLLDFLFVFGFDWGMFGAAFATCLCSAFSICVNAGYCQLKKLNIRIRWKNYDIRKLWRIVRNGFSVFVLESSAGIVTFVFILEATSLYGALGASIYTVIMNWTLIAVNMVLGITQATQPLISLSYGAGEYGKMYRYRKYSIVSGLVAGVLYLVVGYGFTDSLVNVFATDSTQLVSETVRALRLYLPAYIIMGVGICIGIYFQSIESAGKSLTLMLLRGIILPVTGAVGFSALFGTTGLWLAVPAAEFVTAVIAVILVAKEKKMRSVVAANNVGMADRTYRIITISRQFGSGGHRIGCEVARHLGIPVYDKEVNEMTSVLSGYSESAVQGMEDKKPMPLGLFCKNHYQPITLQIFLAQCKAIENFAAKGPCVIVGRCAEHVLSGKYPLVNIFVHAPMRQRVERVAEYEHCNVQEAEKLVRESDKARSEYHDFFTNTEWGRMDNYDMTVNSAQGIEACVDAVLAFVGKTGNDVNNE